MRCALRDESPCHRKVVILSGLVLKELVEFLKVEFLNLSGSSGKVRAIVKSTSCDETMKRLKQAMNASDVRSVTNSKFTERETNTHM